MDAVDPERALLTDACSAATSFVRSRDGSAGTGTGGSGGSEYNS